MANFYVSTTGNDSTGDGSIGNPWRTINKAINTQGFAGNTIFVRGGTYDHTCLSWQNTIRAGTSWTNAITISAYPSETVILQSASGAAAFWFKSGPNNAEIKYWILKDLKMDGRDAAEQGVKLHGARFGDTYVGPNFVRLDGCEIYNSKFSGLLIDGSGHEFINTKSHDNGLDFHDHGIYLEGHNCLIRGCEFYNNVGYGIHNFNGYTGERASNNTFVGNYCYDNGLLGTDGQRIGYGIIISSGSDNLCYNNICKGNRSGGIQVAYRSVANSKIYNNTIYSNTGPGIYIEGGSANTIIKNNILWQNTIPIDNRAGTATTAANNSTVDPKFVSASNFHLQSTSPCIDTGVTLSEFSTDYDSVARPQGSAWDIGAYEFVGGGTPDTTPPTGSITSPPTASVVSGTITIVCTAADNVGVANVQFYLDGLPLGGPIT